MKTARTPFHFFSRLSLTFVTGDRARDAGELAARLKAAPDMVVYAHTHRFLQEHQSLSPEPPNDFAVWVSRVVQDEILGERLAAIDTVRFSTLADLRTALVDVLETHLDRNGPSRIAPPGKELHFLRAQRFSLPTPHAASTLPAFADALKKVTTSSLYLHVFEARLRPPLGINDFSFWLGEELDEKPLAKKIERLDPYTHTMEGLRKAILELIDGRLAHGPA